MADDRKYIYVKGEKIYVSDEIYKAYKKSRYKYRKKTYERDIGQEGCI